MPTTPLEHVHLIAVGINYTSDATPPEWRLLGCVRDARMAHDLLRTEIRLLAEQEEDAIVLHTTLLVDEQQQPLQEGAAGMPADSLPPTKANILARLQSALQQPASHVLFYFSGHGTQLPEQVRSSLPELDHNDECLLCAGGDTIRDNELHALANAASPSSSLACIFDCCHCGTMCDLPISIRPQPTPLSDHSPTIMTQSLLLQSQLLQPSNGNDALTPSTPPGCLVSLSSCMDPQVSLERDGRGLFTSALLGGEGAAGRLLPTHRTMPDLLWHLFANTPPTQTCVLSCRHADIGVLSKTFGQVFLVPRG
jgi:hypothetical protein